MIKEIINLLAADDWLVGDDDIDFAKGKYALPKNWKEAKVRKKMAVKKLTYLIEFDTKTGETKINGVKRSIRSLGQEFDRLNQMAGRAGNKISQAADKTGLAGAAVTELGRTISDANYGMTAMANNLQQLSTLLVTLIATSGGVTKAARLMWKALKGPLGIIIIFQTIFTLMERTALKSKETAKSSNGMLDALDGQLAAMKELYELHKLRGESVDDLLTKEQELLDLKFTELQYQLLELQNERALAHQSAKRLSFWEAMTGKRAEITKEEAEGLAALDAAILETEAKLQRLDMILKSGKTTLTDPDKNKNKKRKDLDFVDAPRAGVVRVFDEESLTELQKWAGKQLQVSAELAGQELAILSDKFKMEENMRQENLASEKRAADQRLEMIALVGDGIESFGNILGTQTKEGKLIASAGALISTYAAVTKALNTPGLGVARIPYAISVGAFGLARVAAINRVRVPSSGGGGGGSSAQGNGENIIRPSFNIVGQSGASQLRDVVESQVNRPVRAYVTTKDIRSGQELDRNTRGGGTIG